MESSRTQINLVAGGFTNLYTAASIAVGMKLGLQNLSSDPIIITLGTSGSVACKISVQASFYEGEISSLNG